MTVLDRKSFARGWCPDCDAVNAPIDALLRMDNLILDERGVPSLRKGSTLLSTGGGDAHSLYTTYLSDVRFRMVGSGTTVYANGASIATTFGAGADISFGSYFGNIFFA